MSLKIQLYRRSEKSSLGLVGSRIEEQLRALQYSVSVLGINGVIDGQGFEKQADIGIAYGLIRDMSYLAAHRIKIAGLTCEGPLTDNEIKILKNLDLNQIWVPSAWVANRFQEAGFVENLVLMPHGIDNTELLTELPLLPLQILMIFNSYPRPNFHVMRKGIFEVLEAFSNHKLPRGTKLILRTNYRSYYSSFDLKNVIFFEEYCDNINDLFEQCNAVLCPSYAEGFGLVGLEAISRGIPLISTKTGNDYLTEENHIHLDTPVTAEGIAESINVLHKNYVEYKSKLISSHSKIVSEYSWNNIGTMIDRQIKQLLPEVYSANKKGF